MLPNNNINIPYSSFLNQTTGRPNQEWLLWLMNPSLVSLKIGSALGVTSGGTGLITIPTNGQLLIGNGTGYTLNPLTEGNYINVVNGSGTIKVDWENLLPPEVNLSELQKKVEELYLAPSFVEPVSYSVGAVFGISVGVSPFTYVNTTGSGVNIIVSGGGISKMQFSRDGSTFYSTGSFYGFFYLAPNDRLKVTYATSPTMTGVPA